MEHLLEWLESPPNWIITTLVVIGASYILSHATSFSKSNRRPRSLIGILELFMVTVVAIITIEETLAKKINTESNPSDELNIYWLLAIFVGVTFASMIIYIWTVKQLDD